MGKRNYTPALKYEIEFADDQPNLTVETNAQDQLRWEINHDGQSWLNRGEAPSFSKLLETAFYAGRRQNLIDTKHFEVWVRNVTALYGVQDDEDDKSPGDEDKGDGPATFR